MMPKEKFFSTYSWQGFLLSKMGYCSPGWFLFFKINFALSIAAIRKMKYRGYKEIRQLYEKKELMKNCFIIFLVECIRCLKVIILEKQRLF